VSRQVSEDSSQWTEEDVLYLAQYGQRMDEVEARATELGVDLPQPGGQLAPARPTGSLADYTTEQLEAELAARSGTVPDTYEEWTKGQLQAELTNRGIAFGSETKSELIDKLATDDAGG
jgi:hypothetical protein